MGYPMNRRSVSDIELGKRSVDLDKAVALAYALETQLQALIAPDENEAVIIGRGEAIDREWFDDARSVLAMQAMSDLLKFARKRRDHLARMETYDADTRTSQILALLDQYLTASEKPAGYVQRQAMSRKKAASVPPSGFTR